MTTTSIPARSWFAWFVWAAGVFSYITAVMQRTSFGIAGIDAAKHFSASASIIGLFVVLQLLVYAGLQIPVGVLIDRFGSRILLITGTGLMLLGQVAVAFAVSVPSGVVGRIIVGAGDAMIFASVLRLIPVWFPPGRAPVLTQLTAMLGQTGQIASAIPFAWALHTLGWRDAFLWAASVCLVSLVGIVAFVRDSPQRHSGRRIIAETEIVPMSEAVRSVWAHPATRLGLWTHFTTCFSTMAFAMMWGYPYLTAGEGLTGAQAGTLMTVFALSSLVAGPAVGILTGRHPYRRSALVLAVVAVTTLPWVIVLLWPGPAPLPLLTILVVCLAIGGPGSAIGFDYARTFMPAQRLGTATGVINTGGFTGALIVILLTGVIIDLAGGYGLTSFRLGMAIQLPIALIGLVGIVRTRRQVRARLSEEEGVLIEPIVVVLAQRFRAYREARASRR